MPILRAGIAHRPQQSDGVKANGPELVQESAAFLGARNSSKPVAFLGCYLCREWMAQDNFGGKNLATGL